MKKAQILGRIPRVGIVLLLALVAVNLPLARGLWLDSSAAARLANRAGSVPAVVFVPTTTTFSYTGAVQTFVVPAGVTSINIEAWGAQGGNAAIGGTGGLGGYATGTLAVTPGDTLNIYVGGQGGFNGGGAGGAMGNTDFGGASPGFAPSGGGASDVRVGGTGLVNRVIVGGGGGGAGANGDWPGCQTAGPAGDGGPGGGATAGDGTFGVGNPCNCGGGGGDKGTGGSQSAGGVQGGYHGSTNCLRNSWTIGAPGVLGLGGNGSTAFHNGTGGGGGGGGGYYGGGSGGNGSDTTPGGGGGGGSSYVGGVTSGSTSSGVRSGDGQVKLTYDLLPCVAPMVTLDPMSTTVVAGNQASFTTSVTGQPTPGLQWQVSSDNGVSWSNIAGATSSLLSFTAVAGDNGKQYRVVATSTCGTATSAAAILTVQTAPNITGNPLSTTVCAGTNVGFASTATGNPTPTVQWFLSTDNGITFNSIPGATNGTLSLGAAQASLSGNQYRAVWTNSAGTATTNTVTLTVNTAPTVTDPMSTTVVAGNQASFTTTTTGQPTPGLQWQVSSDNGVSWSNIAGATSSSLSFTAVAGDNGKQYRVVATSTCGTATSAAASLTVQTAPNITGQPLSTTVCAGTNVGFASTATGNPTPTVQWFVSTDNGSTFNAVPGATTGTLSLGAAQASMSGNQYQAVWTNSAGTATTNTVTLTVNTAPTVTDPMSTTVVAGNQASFTTTTTGQPTPSLQWQVSSDNGVSWSNIAGATSSLLSFTAVAGDNGKQYRVVATSTCGTATSAAAILTVQTAPNITGNPLSTTVCAGTSVGFGSAATGNPTPTVQWFVSTDNGVTFNPVPGATSAALSLGATQASMNGNKYKAVYTNTAGTATTNIVTLTVNSVPVVTTNPTNQLGTIGAMATFTASASGTPIVQWQVSTDNGVSWSNIAGATNTTLSFTVQQSDFGHQFRAVFSNICGSNVPTTAATLINCSSVQVTVDPTSQNVLKTATATFTASASGNPTPAVQWEVSTDGGNTYNNVPGATSTTLTLPAVTLSMNGNRYRAIFSNSCNTVRTQSAVLQVSNYDSSFADPLVCTGPGDLMTGTAALQNNGPQTNASYTIAALGPNLIGIPGSGIAIDPATNQPIGTITVTAGSVTWNGTLTTGQAVNITYKATLAPGVQQNVQFCINASGTVGNMTNTIQVCATPGCPAGRVPVLVNDQKAGSVLIFPYYTSGNGADTRITLTNTSNLLATPQNPNYTFVHLMFIDGATCQQADQYVCLTPNASLTIKTSEYDPGATGWVLAVAVDANGLPIKNNVLIGNAFVSDGTYQDNYGAEALAANNAPLAAVVGGQARLFFDGQSYDAVPKAFSVELQSPVDVVGQKIVTVGLNGIVGSAMTGALQVGTGLVINGKESPASSFVNLLTGGCQATGLISTSSPRVSLGMSKLIPSGQSGTINFNTGPAVGILMTPKASKFGGIRTLHKTVMTTSTITIPVFVPSC